MYIPIQNINELLRLQQTQPEESVDRLIRNIELKSIKFVSILPQTSIQAKCSLDISFFLINNGNIEQQLRIRKEQATLQMQTNESGDSYFLFECNCEMPIIPNDDSKQIIYIYCLRNEQTNAIITNETLLTVNKRCRVFDMKPPQQNREQNRFMSRMNSFDSFQIDTSLFKEQIDGLVVFQLDQNIKLNTDFMRHWYRNALNILLRLDNLFNRTLCKETHENFLQRIDNVHRNMNTANSDYKILFDRLLNVKFKVELTKMNAIEYLEERQYMSLITMFFIVAKYEVDGLNELDFYKKIFKLHKPRLIQYFKSLNEYFVDKNKSDICNYLNQYLKFIRETGTLEISLSALVTNCFLTKQKNINQLLNFEFATSITQDELLTQLEYYYDLFEKSIELGALFINYIAAKTTQMFSIYKKGHNRTSFFPLQTYLVYMNLNVIKMYDNNLPVYQHLDNITKDIFKDLIRYVSFKYIDLEHEQQVLLIESNDKLLKILIEKCSKEYDIITLVIELQLRIIFSNQKAERTATNEPSLSRMPSSYNDFNDTQYAYKDLIDSIKQWFKKEADDSLLINYNIEKRPPSRAALIAFDAINNNENRYTGTDYEYQMYNSLFEININQQQNEQMARHAHGEFSIENFRDELFKIFKDRCRTRLDYPGLIELADFRAKFDFGKFKPKRLEDKLCSQFDSLVQERITTQPKSDEMNDLCTKLYAFKLPILRVYIERLLKDKWTSTTPLLKFMLQWPVFLTIYENQMKITNTLVDSTPNQYNNSNCLLSYEMNQQYRKACRYLIDTLNKLSRGSAEISDIILIKQNISSAQRLVKFIRENIANLDAQLEFNNFELLIDVRNKEVNEFERYLKNMKLFVQFCANFEQIDITRNQKVIEHLTAKKQLGSLDQYCKVLPVKALNMTQSANIIYFTDINITIMEVIDKIVSMDRSKCVLFDHYFKESLMELKSNQEIQHLITNLWSKTLTKWKQLSDSIEFQTIKLCHLDEILKQFFQMNFHKMYTEITYLLHYFQITNLNERLDKITLWYKFTASYEAAFAIKEIKEKLKLNNKFTELNDLLQISSQSYQTWKLDKMNDVIAQTVRCLEVMNDRNKLDCLVAFSQSLELVNWLREKINGLSQLKTLVDSLSMSAALDKSAQAGNRTVLARTLREAGTAYAALIYDLRSNADFNQFMLLCNKVCDYLESDSKIAEKLLAVKDQVVLFEQVLQQTESAEKNSLKIAKDLNKHGVYVIQSITGNEDSIEQLIRLDISQTETSYSYNDLKELQNILLLIAPRSSASDSDDYELKYFIQMLEIISQLATKYLRLIQFGCVFYDTFKIELKCDITNTELNVPRIQINQLNDFIDTVTDCTDYLTRFLTDTFHIWSNYVTNLRNSYDCLNYFTIKQLKLITNCLKISNDQLICSDQEFSTIKTLLFNLNPKLTLNSLNEAFKQPFLNDPTEFKLQIENSLKDVQFSAKLNANWKQFITDQSRSVLSLKHLAVIFDYIKRDQSIHRIIPGYLSNRGQPNLIKCSQQMQIPIVLSIYGISKQQQMPTNDEIVYCDTSTDYEDLEIFLRRAFKSNGDQIYTVLNVQDLRYETTAQLEKFLISNKIIHKTDLFVLVFICCSNSNSLISSLFSKNKVIPILLPNSDLELYLDYNLQTKYRAFTLNSENSTNKSYSVKALLSQRSGNGKSMYVKQLISGLTHQFDYKVIRIKSAKLNLNTEINKLISVNNSNKPTIYHIDLAYEVFQNVDHYLFNLIICGYLKQSVTGQVWRRNTNTDLYFIEMSPPYYKQQANHLISFHSMLNYLPRIEFKTPNEYLYSLKNRQQMELLVRETPHLDDNLFTFCYTHLSFQRCVYYLRLVDELKQEEARNPTNDVIDYGLNTNERFQTNYQPELQQYTEIQCLETLFDLGSLNDPNWLELNNFCNFLDQQLGIYERSTIVSSVPCLKSLVVQLLCLMSKDFGLPSLKINFNLRDEQQPLNLNRSISYRAQSSAFELTDQFTFNISLNDLDINESRRWENMIHPYIIFNADGESIVFLGTCMDRSSHKFINPQTNEFLENRDQSIPRISSAAFMELIQQKTGIFENFNQMVREKKIDALCKVMGLDVRTLMTRDLNSTYELTLDNCLKMMAIFLRFKANNPVVIMGETGCGKTSLIKYFAFLNLRSKCQKKNLFHVKIHGGTTADQIEQKLLEAEKLAKENFEIFRHNRLLTTQQTPITAILFLDEANTTEAIGLIKEIMCDLTCNGRAIEALDQGLKIVAAVNPYKKHSDEMIQKLEQSGLGFYISSAETKEKIGQIPMRQLVYRVQPLPTSLLPIVWDFGRLNKNVEKIYIKQMLDTAVETQQFGIDFNIDEEDNEKQIDLLCDMIVESQIFMRSKNDECSYVSIRDVERVIKVTNWFLVKQSLIFKRMNKRKIEHSDDSYQELLAPLQRAFILALTVCYHSSLYKAETRLEYRKYLQQIIKLNTKTDWILTEILKCQHIFMDEIDLNQMTNIARNSALLENVFMMIICIELRIPLFIIGKPGSSKSLAKSIVSRAMIGRNSKSELYQNLKETYFVNFQCSPLTTSEMIVKAFKEASDFQKSNDLTKSVSVVNLDEIGLAEGSESMPLKTLHSLLEDGACEDDDKCEEYHRVGVIGISNWALDPAKMNRGLFVSRGEAGIDELISSAEGICNYDKTVYDCIKPHVRLIAEAYLELCNQSSTALKREFFGLRDYYSLIKMLYWFARNDRELKWSKLEQAVKRNFNGVNIDIIEPFRKRLHNILPNNDLNTIDLIKSALKSEHMETNSRYLLFLTENSSAIDIIQTYLTQVVGLAPTSLSVIFGSSFRNDLQYSEVCRNISLIKHCMEVGKTVILLNSYNLYESLYDALNQYYYELHSQKFVDLGLGTHRIKCSVNEKFRLIVIAEKAAVYDSKKFPIPLINRLEKHFLNAANMLNSAQIDIRNKLDQWCHWFVKSNFQIVTDEQVKLRVNEMFIGLHEDTTSSIVLHLSQKILNETDLISEAKQILIQCATPDSLIRFCGNERVEQEQRDSLWTDYFYKQQHLALKDLMVFHLNKENGTNLIQITTFSKSTLSSLDRDRFNVQEICLLKSFDTQLQFQQKIEQFLSVKDSKQRILLIQTYLTQTFSADLISCARHTIVEKFKEFPMNRTFIFLLINLPRENAKTFIGFQLGYWSCYHLDEIEPESDEIPQFKYLNNKSLSDLLRQSFRNETNVNLSSLLKRLAHSACSLIVDTNLERTIKRIDLFTRLCDASQQFVNVIIIRLIGLLTKKEEEYSAGASSKWLFKEAASLKTIKEYATLRRACQFYFESKLSPLLGFLLSFLDRYSNLDTYLNAFNDLDSQWKADLWIGLVKNSDICHLDYADMRTKDNDNNTNVEMRVFKCQSDWLTKSFQEAFDENRRLQPSLPFFWILVGQLTKFYDNFIESNKKTADETTHNEIDATSLSLGKKRVQNVNFFEEERLNKRFKKASINANYSPTLNNYENTISNFFEETKLYSLINEIVRRHPDQTFTQSIIDSYINDFILIKCAINSNQDLVLIKQLLTQMLNDLEVDPVYKLKLKFTLPMVHYLYDGIKDQIESYLKYSKYEPDINKTNNQLSIIDLHTNAVLQTIQLFKQKKHKYFYDKFNQRQTQANLSKLCDLIQLVNQSLNTNDSDRVNLIQQQYESLSLLLLFVDNMTFSDLSNEHFITELNNLTQSLNLDYFNSNINFKTKQTIQNLQNFICYSYNQLLPFKYHDEIQENLNIFYFNSIEYLVFQNRNQTPDDDTIDIILSSITDKQLIYNNLIPFKIEPTYRSLLIQIVFKNYNKKVVENLEKWFQQGTLTGKNGMFESLNELALLFQDCVHDQFIYELTTNNLTLNDQIIKADSFCIDLLEQKVSLLQIFQRKIMHLATYEVTFLETLAKLKFCLSTMAKTCYSKEVYDTHKDEYHFKLFNTNMKKIITLTLDQTEDSHSSGKTDTFINYLIKDMIRKYGSSSIKYIKTEPTLDWMTPFAIIGDQEKVTDKYVLCPYSIYLNDKSQNKYLIYKQTLQECFEKKNMEPIKKLIEQNKQLQKDEHLAYLGISLYQNVTLLYKSIQHSTNQIVEYFEALEPKLLFKSLLNNSFTHNLRVNNENWCHVDLNLLLIQIKFTILYSPKDNDLLAPLKDLITNPIDSSERYLPTMPQDSVYDVKTVLADTAMYSCPNGHKYVIADCHRPWVLGKCNECGADIGGQNHKSADGNIKIEEIVDKTIRGYSLPKSADLDNQPRTERLLNSFEFQIERFFLHACLYLACGDEDEQKTQVLEVMKLAKPVDVKEFFWLHMQKDLKIICQILNLTLDELLLLLHLISFGFLRSDQIAMRNNLKSSFDSKQERLNWEDNFNKSYLTMFLTDVRTHINQANNEIKIKNEGANGSQQSKIYFMAYELLKEPAFKTNYLYENEKFWKFRAPVTFDLMSLDLKNTTELKERFKILKKFNELKPKLKLVFNLPHIIRLINFLEKTLYKNIFKHSAQNKTVEQFLNEIQLPSEWSIDKVKQAINCFQTVWSLGKQDLTEYVTKNSKNSLVMFYKEYQFNMNSKLSYFLPTRSGDGLFSYYLIKFLASIHNEMISFYHNVKQIETQTMALTHNIELFENKDLIIHFDENNDMFRLVQANYTYDLRNLKCVYKFKNIENQLINRYLRNKPLIDSNNMKLFEYSDEINDFSIFKQLKQKTLLDLNIQIDLVDEFKKINEISEALNTLKVIINYASTCEARPTEAISSFIRKIYSNDADLYRLSEQILKTIIIEKCQLTHLKHIWILLMMKRCILYTINNQDPFDYLDVAFKVDSDIEFSLNLIDSNSVIVSVLLVIYQIITFDLSVINSNDEIMDKKTTNIREIMMSVRDYPDFLVPDNIEKLPKSFPDPVRDYEDGADIVMSDEASETNIKLENVYALWKLLCKRIR